MLIVYGATAGVSVVKLYAGAFLPGIMLGGALHRVRDDPREDPAGFRAAVARERTQGGRCRRKAGVQAAHGTGAVTSLFKSFGVAPAGVPPNSCAAQLLTLLAPQSRSSC
jgi:hypothetical protein